MKRKFKGEWVLIEYTELNDNLEVVEGEVIAHSPDKDFIYREQLRYKDKQLALTTLVKYQRIGL